jgi:hypothetical protein
VPPVRKSSEENPKSEYRNPKQIRIKAKRRKQNQEARGPGFGFSFSGFGFVSDFDIRISDFLLRISDLFPWGFLRCFLK